MFKDFDISSFKKMKPPGDNTFDTMQEVKALKKIPIRKAFVKEFDDQESAFKKTAEREGIETGRVMDTRRGKCCERGCAS